LILFAQRRTICTEGIEMDENLLQQIYHKHNLEGGFMPWDEWSSLVRKAYPELIRRVMNSPYDSITMTYSELGSKIGLHVVSEWFNLKIALILYACAEYAHIHQFPLITAIVVNKDTGQPGKGFWGLPWIPVPLRKQTGIEDITSFYLDASRDKFWIEELKRLDFWGKKLPDVSSAL